VGMSANTVTRPFKKKVGAYGSASTRPGLPKKSRHTEKWLDADPRPVRRKKLSRHGVKNIQRKAADLHQAKKISGTPSLSKYTQG
jgi:hypothetical protein